ncbi:MAG: Strongly-conserved Zn-finger binding protein (TFIIIA) [Vezdaea aestivalis]|nr:MAG: Strongly-conserved Zn-finger binding protein (TFIIIA) [Vezdaea aestivalis]
MHPSAPRFLCLICPAIAPYGDGSLSLGLGFQTHYELHSHQAEVHPPTCIHCDKVFPSTRPLLQHLEVRHGVEADLPQSLESVHLCEEEDCGKTFSKKSNLTVHIRSVHQGEKPFECGVVSLDNIEGWTEGLGCGAKFKAKASLEQHIRTAHLGKKSKATERRVKKGVGRKSQRRQQSAISALTGVSYGVDTGRTIACLEETCEFRFMRLYDLRVHLVSRHGLSEADVDGLLQEKNESSQGQMVQPGGLMVEDDDPFLEAERQASLGGAFWLGGIEPEEIANDEDYHLFGELTQTLQEENDRMGDEAVDPRLR